MRLKPIALPILTLCVLLWAESAIPEPEIITLGKADRQDLSITVYQDGYAQVRDHRRLVLPAGRSEVRFADVSAQIEPQTAIVRGLAADTRLLEINFDFETLTPRSLMAKSVGEPVWFLKALPKDNRDEREAAVLLSAIGGAVLGVGGRLEVLIGREASRRIAYRGLPPDLRPSPTLSVQIESSGGGQQEVGLSYITRGLHWHGTYRLHLSLDSKSADLDAYITLLNESGISYENVELHALAGRVNKIKEQWPPPPPAPKVEGEVETLVVTGSRIVRRRLADYQLYTIPTRVSIANGQEKQLELFSASGVGTEILQAFLVYDGDEDDEFIEAKSVLRIENTEENGLGFPLPKGEVTIYARDAKGKPVYLGTDYVKNTPENEPFRLELETKSALSGKLTKSLGATRDCEILGERYELCVTSASYVFHVSNVTLRTQTIEYVHAGFRNVKLKESNYPATADSRRVSWEPITVRPGRALNIRYTIENRFTRRLRNN